MTGLFLCWRRWLHHHTNNTDGQKYYNFTELPNNPIILGSHREHNYEPFPSLFQRCECCETVKGGDTHPALPSVARGLQFLLGTAWWVTSPQQHEYLRQEFLDWDELSSQEVLFRRSPGRVTGWRRSSGRGPASWHVFQEGALPERSQLTIQEQRAGYHQRTVWAPETFL